MEVSIIHREAQFLAQSFDILQRIDTRRQDEEHRGTRTRFLVRFREFDCPVLNVFITKFLFNEISEK